MGLLCDLSDNPARITGSEHAVRDVSRDYGNDDRARIADSFVLPDEPLNSVPAGYVQRCGR